MITEHRYKKLLWVDVENPDQDDINILIKDYGIHPLSAQELRVPSERAKSDAYDQGSIYTVLHYPDHPSHGIKDSEFEVDYIIQKDSLITVHYRPIDLFFEFAKTLQVENSIERRDMGTTGGHLFFQLNNLLYQGLSEELEVIRHDIKKIEARIFHGEELRMVEEISSLQRRLLDFKQSIRFHGPILKSFNANARKMFGTSFTVDEEHIHNEYLKVESLLENERELLRELRDTNDSLLTSKSNDIIKRFTLMAFFTFPLALIVAIMGLHNAPAAIHGDQGFWIIVITVIALFLAMYAYVVHKKWL